MKFNAWYRMSYGYFLKIRFEGILNAIIPLELETEEWGISGDEVKTTRFSKRNTIQDFIRCTPVDEVISYSFELNNGVLRERIAFHGSIHRPIVNIKCILSPLLEDVYLRNIFKSFGVYLAVFIKEHHFALTGQEYILSEYKQRLERHSAYTISCGDYTFVHSRSKSFSEDYLGIEAELDQNPSIAMDSRKGITLVLYRDMAEKDSFTVDEQTVKLFGSLKKNDAQLCNWALVPLLKENTTFDLLYSFTSDYPDTVQFLSC
ncbi:hypothetical protein EHV15_35740 [Paenibacillus oralis]|uniref:Uncharacterized protein n=1 Tax=Paenibacillus oralis TaxID=2490856 RepID=A0A3P3TA66_9BACL|nr:hypothetical protein [Paenibacillus oralis]RRJ54926.1 hypothetical protein EHV15_35740 [Paenibacillus oralis]